MPIWNPRWPPPPKNIVWHRTLREILANSFFCETFQTCDFVPIWNQRWPPPKNIVWHRTLREIQANSFFCETIQTCDFGANLKSKINVNVWWEFSDFFYSLLQGIINLFYNSLIAYTNVEIRWPMQVLENLWFWCLWRRMRSILGKVRRFIK